MTHETDSPFLDTAEAAAYLRLKKRTLDNMRWLGTGLLDQIYYPIGLDPIVCRKYQNKC
jgi:hypothetical protein